MTGTKTANTLLMIVQGGLRAGMMVILGLEQGQDSKVSVTITTLSNIISDESAASSNNDYSKRSHTKYDHNYPDSYVYLIPNSSWAFPSDALLLPLIFSKLCIQP